MHQCCTLPYDLEFDKTQAQQDLSDYLSKGPKKNTKPLLQMLDHLDLKGGSLMDIGGGIGTVVFELFKKDIRSAVHIDISSAFVEAFQEEAAKRSLSNSIVSFRGDFVDLHGKLDLVDLVTLDKVICCYPEYEDLVRHSVSKAKKWYALVIPRDLWWVKCAHYVEGRWRKMKGKHFTTYIHPISPIEQIIQEEGMQLYQQSFKREWYYAIYQR